jgi:hypothetical protein
VIATASSATIFIWKVKVPSWMCHPDDLMRASCVGICAGISIIIGLRTLKRRSGDHPRKVRLPEMAKRWFGSARIVISGEKCHSSGQPHLSENRPSQKCWLASERQSRQTTHPNPFQTPILRFHPLPRLPCDATRAPGLFEIAVSLYPHNPKVEGSNPSRNQFLLIPTSQQKVSSASARAPLFVRE